MALVPHQGLVSRNRWVRAPGSRTAAPSFKNCRTVETMFAIRQILHGRVLDRSYYYACLVFKHCGCSGQLDVRSKHTTDKSRLIKDKINNLMLQNVKLN